jgi:hypothetical protein
VAVIVDKPNEWMILLFYSAFTPCYVSMLDALGR